MNENTWLSLIDTRQFRKLFIDELGWSNPDQPAKEIMLEGVRYSLEQVAGYKGMRVWFCDSLPSRKVQREIDLLIGQDSHERLVIFASDDHQQWRWPRRAQLGGANAKLVMHDHPVGVGDERLVRQLRALAIDFEDNLSLIELIARIRLAFDAESETTSAQAARLMGTLYAELESAGWGERNATLLLARLLFLFFGDDSGMWAAGMFHRFLVHTTSSSSLADDLEALFAVLNTKEADRGLSDDSPLAEFRYVNGGLFEDEIDFSHLTETFRDELITASDFDWSLISPAVFGSMFQTVKSREARRHGGEHYTTEKNILRTIQPLFLDGLRAKLDAAWDDRSQLTRLHNELGRIRVLDPACGCGNFLIVAYRELRSIELDLLVRRRELVNDEKPGDHAQLSFDVSGDILVTLDHFFGIEIEEWPARIAETALLLMDHLANLRMAAEFGTAPDRLPIRLAPKIVRGSALVVDWDDVVPFDELTFIVGNPPFNGSRTMTAQQKSELRGVADGIREAGFLDFVAGWYFLAARAMAANSSIKCGLVSTNSVAQGEQPAIIWRPLFDAGVHINFAHRSFVWENESSGQAAVHCVIIGFSRKEYRENPLYTYEDGRGEGLLEIVDRISPYLHPGDEYAVGNRQNQISAQREMRFGNMPADGGKLVLSLEQADELRSDYPETIDWIVPYIGAEEFIRGRTRYCLWLEGISEDELRGVPPVWARVEENRAIRAASARPKLAATPHLFAQITQRPSEAFLLVPGVSSERRLYVPMGFFEPGTVASNSCLVVVGATLFDFGILTSQIHMAWMRTVGGRLKSDYRYSKDVVYNNFIFPQIGEEQEARVAALAEEVLTARNSSGLTDMARMYDSSSMPSELRAAHRNLDQYVDSLYAPEGFVSDRERATHLLGLHKVREQGLLAQLSSRSPRPRRQRR